MSLPSLPQQNRSKEADFGVRLRQLIKKGIISRTSGIEIKHTRGAKSFNLREWKANQRAHAHMIQSDEGCLIRVVGHNGEPDYIFMKREKAYVVIQYPHAFYIISANLLADETGPSLSESRASVLEQMSQTGTG